MKGSKLCKVRCITLNYHASKLVNFEVISAMILEEGESVFNVHTEHKIKRKRRAGGTVDVVTEPANKRYRISFKRRRMHDHWSVHLGNIYGRYRGVRALLQPDPPWAMI